MSCFKKLQIYWPHSMPGEHETGSILIDMETISRIFRALVFGLIALTGLFMAVVFTFSTVIAVAILYAVARFRGRKFSVQEYWTVRQSGRKPIFSAGARTRESVTDIEARDVR